MIRKALTLSIIVIFSLLIVQSVWLYKVILNERISFKAEAEQVLLSSMTFELDSRLKNSSSISSFNVQVVNSGSLNENTQNVNQRFTLDTVSLGSKSTLKLSMEQVFQEFLRKTHPINIDSLANFFNIELSKKGYSTDFTLEYLDIDNPDLNKSLNYSSSSSSFGNFELTNYLNASNSIVLNAKIYYPLFVYKQDFLLIGLASIILLIFIVVAIVLQFKMLSRQITLAQLRENLTSFFTHELRSPLQSALSSIEMAEMYSEKKEVNSFLELSRNKVIYINKLIEKLLDINKLEKNKVNLIMERFLLRDAISQYLDHYFGRTDKKIEIEALFSPELSVYGDRVHISNAIGNLIENAVKYSGESVNIKIYAEENSQDITIIVEDNGIGIPPADQKRVFERFYRVNSAEHATKGKGFGLGLNYVQWVAITHKGEVRVESEQGIGSKFIFTIRNK